MFSSAPSAAVSGTHISHMKRKVSGPPFLQLYGTCSAVRVPLTLSRHGRCRTRCPAVWSRGFHWPATTPECSASCPQQDSAGHVIGPTKRKTTTNTTIVAQSRARAPGPLSADAWVDVRAISYGGDSECACSSTTGAASAGAELSRFASIDHAIPAP